MAEIPRRDFLKAVPVAAGGLALANRRRGAEASKQSEPIGISAVSYEPARDYPIRAKRHSEVTLTDRFWKPKIALNAAVTIPTQLYKLQEPESVFSSNVLEAAILSLEAHPDPALQAMVDERIRALTSTPATSNDGFEVAATHFAATGKRALLDRAIVAADGLYETFRRTNPPFSGGERDAINSVQLYRATGNRKYLDLAKHYLDIRGLENSVNRSRHNQSYEPVLEQREAVGHAVNCASLMVSLTDVGVLTGLTQYLGAARRMWFDAVARKLYITGGIGTTGNEGFGEPYSLPNLSAYAETCAVLMFMTLNHRLFLATGDSTYIDVMERGMYNNALSGVAASGDRFFYVNRLASAGDGRDARWQHASLECCPPNLVRFLASMPGCIYAQGPDEGIFVNLYVSSDVAFAIKGTKVTLSVESEMPWGGTSRIAVKTVAPVRGIIRLRIPGWARGVVAPGGLYSYASHNDARSTISINGSGVPSAPDGKGYVSLDRTWKNGDVIVVTLPIETRWVAADQRVKSSRGRMAVERGPVVYCVEAHDIEGGRTLTRVFDPSRALQAETDPSFFGGCTVLRTEARSIARPSAPPDAVTLVPYHLWANRAPAEMTVWLSTREYELGDTGPAGGVVFYVNPTFQADGWRYLEAAPFDQSAGAKWGCFRRAIDGARGTAIGTGMQNTADILNACGDPGTAAQLCHGLTLNGVGGWFLPSRDELAAMYRSLKAAGAADFRDAGLPDNFSYWTSSQETADMAHHIDFADAGRQHYDDKDFPRRVRAIRAF
ncbi:MAG TPA: beta-L-arabinofuranosidase domain-containing protein [Vicinamibacterales bacterium]|jgi:DUF1680 family protein|nr:beta-L-arabinofuranosidase domain-containing protein [Vicinamibacterales bacterium]